MGKVKHRRRHNKCEPSGLQLPTSDSPEFVDGENELDSSRSNELTVENIVEQVNLGTYGYIVNNLLACWSLSLFETKMQRSNIY